MKNFLPILRSRLHCQANAAGKTLSLFLPAILLTLCNNTFSEATNGKKAKANLMLSVDCVSNLTVNDLGDGSDAAPGNGVCATSGGTCTLRAAIQEANALSGCSPITISFSTNGTITLGSSLPDGAAGTRIINGNGPANTIIQASANENTATYNIFSISSSTANWTWNNLTIRHGGNDASGGGLTVFSGGTLTVSNSIIEKCRGDSGGAIFCLSSTLNVTNSTIRNNRVTDAGGGIYCQNSQFTITNSTITNNQTNSSSSNGIGGGIASLSNALTMTGTTVSNNTVMGSTNSLGGAMYLTNVNPTDINITDCIFSNNSAAPTGASTARGGGVYFVTTSTGNNNITDCLFTGNSASPAGSNGNGGGLYCSISNLVTLTNTVFSTNTVSQRGGGIYAGGLGPLTLNNVTISGNTAPSGAGGGINQSITTTNLNNTLIANNTGGDYTRLSGTLNAQYSLIEEGLSAINGTNTANRTGDPALNPDLTLTSGSLAVGGGSNALIPGGITTDLAGNTRIQQGTVDIGAYESAFVGNALPSITAGAALTRQRGSTGTTSTIATASDTETAAGSLNVTATTVPSGLTVTAITNLNGTISATVAASCTATLGANTVVLTVTDGGGLIATANLTVNITANTAPTLSYNNASVNAGNATTVNPATGPSDNGSVSTIIVQSVSPSTAPGTINVNSTTGVVSVPNNIPAGSYTVTIRATDNCGTTTDATFTLTATVNCPGTLTVNDTGDQADLTPGDGVCATSGGVCTLRAAIQEANALIGCSPLTINLNVTGSITLSSTLPSIAHPALTISGPGANQLTVSGNNAFRVFTVNSGNYNVTISGMTVANGSVNGYGAGIFNSSTGTVTMTNLAFTGNTGSSSSGGGGISHTGTGTLNIFNSIFTGNSGGSGGGGVDFPEGTGTINITNCTITGNTANLGAGVNLFQNGTINIINSTISGNTAINSGGGIVRFNGTINVKNTIVAGNTAPTNPDVEGSFTSQGNNLIGNTTGSTGFGGNDLLNVSALLSAVGNYGGTTQTMALLPGSPAINAGIATGAPSSDQRGSARVGTTDIGAFESQGFTLAINSGNNQSTPTGSAFVTPLSVTVTSTNGEPINGGKVKFTPPGSGASATIAGNPATIAGGTASSGTLTANATAGGPYTVTATANGSNTVNFSLTNTVANTAPTLTAASAISRKQGSPTGVAVTIGNVADGQTAAGSLTVTQIAGGSATGITITNITNANGTISAQVSASCTATSGTVRFQVSDGSLTGTGDLQVDITANTAPTLVYGNASVSAGGSTTNTPTTATDNGSITGYSVQSFGTYSGTISVNAAGLVSISAATPIGSHTVTIRATDNCNTTTDANFTLTISNNNPTITAGATAIRQRGSTGTSATIATVNDTETPAGSLTVTATTVPIGITVTNITNASGTITATMAAGCDATLGDNTVVLTVTDANSGTNTANFTVNVTDNTPPTFTYGNISVNAGASTTNTPTTATDNGSITSYSVQSPGSYTGTISVNTSGVVSFTNAGPVGIHTVLIRATDNCTAFTDAQITVNIACPPITLSGVTLTQPTCAVNTGTAVVNATGTGTIEYSKDGTNWQPSNTFSTLAPANYTFSVRLQSNPTCVATSTPQTINAVPGAPTLSGVTLTQPTCAVNTGTAVVNATGTGTIEYSKDGTNWVSSNTFSSLASANYTFSVRLVSNTTCIATSTQQTINAVPSAPTLSGVTLTQPTCAVNTGTAVVSVTGSGTLEYSKDGTNWSSSNTFSSLAPANYTFSVRLVSNPTCVATSTQQTINTVPVAPTLTGVTLTQPTCATPTGTAVVNATGSGTLEYSKDGTNWVSSNTFSSLAPANYTFSVRLVSNPTCVATSTQQTINTVPGAPTLTGVTLTQPTCATPTGTAVVNATGSGTLEYSKDGTNWVSSNTFSALVPANYTFSARLVANPTCVATSTQQTINTVPGAPTLTGVTLTQPTCATPTGTAVVNATGSGTLEYSKDATNWSSSNTFSSLAPTNYTFSVRLVSNPSCIATSTQQTINTVPVVPTLSGVTLTQPTCAVNTGTAVVNANGSGTLEYSKDGTNWTSSNTFSSLAPANYTFSVRLVANPTCVATSTPQTINAVPAAPTLSGVTLTQPTCATPTGTAVVNATGSGTLEYSKDGTNWTSSNTFSSLAPANYTFSVRLVSNPTCVATSTQQTINTVPGAPTLTGVTLTQPTCATPTGTAVVNATGSGTLEYSKDGTNWVSSNTFSSLASANYTFSVRLIANPTCVATSTQQTINAVPVAPTLTGVTLTQPTCATTGTAVVNATGSGTLEYSKDGTNWVSSNTFSSLASANYTFSVRLVANPTCVATSTQQTINTVPGAPTLTGVTLTQPTCATPTGTAVVNATGSGTLEYSKDGTNWGSSNTFSSLASANYTFSVRLVANPTCVATSTQQTINAVPGAPTLSGVVLTQPTCATTTGTAVVNATGSGTLEYSKDGTNWTSSNTFSSLAPANYTFSVRLQSNPTCVATSTQQTINTVPGAPTLTGVTLTQPTCAVPTGTAVVNATGSGTLEYSKDGTNWTGSNTFSSLAPANYTFSVRLVANPTCVATSTPQTINAVPAAPTLSGVTLTQPTCAVNTGTAVVNATGSGTLEYSKDGTNWTGSNTFSSLAPANYTFSVRLVSNPSCIATSTQQTINAVPGAPTLSSVTLTQPTCAVNTGTAVVNATGTGTIEYSKDGTDWISSNTFSALVPANYTFSARLVANPTCVATSTQQTINTVPGAPTLTGVTLTQPTCATPTGTAVVNATGSGTLEYSKDGTNWTSSNTFSSLAPANYTFSVRLQSNPTCVATSTQQTINTVPGAPTLTGVTLTQPTCAVPTGTAVVNATGSGTLEYSKDGTNWTGSNTFSSLAPANYTFSVRLVSNPTCVATSTQQTINAVPGAPTLTGVTLAQPTCAVTGTAVVNAIGSGTLEYSKDGTNWTGSNTFSSLAPANYTFSVRLVSNPTCVATSTQQTINAVPAAPTLSGVTLTQPTCATPTGTAVVNATGSGTLEYSKDGTNWTGNNTFSSLAPANYTFSVRLVANPTCVATSTQQTINIVPALSAAINYTGSPFVNAGTASATLTGNSGGTFSSAIGLSINAANGEINLALSTPGTYIVTYTIAANGSCPQFQTTTSVEIIASVRIIYVNVSNTAPDQDGSTWAKAFSSLQAGLQLATISRGKTDGVQVWVAQGTYSPGVLRKDAFEIPSGVEVYGGFVGTETLLSERNWKTHTTTLSGEIGSSSLSDNVNHVVVLNATNAATRLDGFTIEKGFADFVTPNQNTELTEPAILSSGGGVLVINKSRGIITNCTITNNRAIAGGGILLQDSSGVSITKSIIWGNEATFGGGVYVLDGSTPRLENLLIVTNKALGGGLYINRSQPLVLHSTIAANQGTGGTAGGIFTVNATVTIKNIILWGNTSPQSTADIGITHSIVEGGYAGTGNSGQNPLFVNAGSSGLAPLGGLGDYHLQNCSPAINSGDNTDIPTEDLDGNVRPYAAVVDKGAYESQSNGSSSPAILTVTENISSGNVQKTAGKITATNQISGGVIEYRAGESVTLLPGFSVAGAIFQAVIGGCQTSGPTNSISDSQK